METAMTEIFEIVSGDTTPIFDVNLLYDDLTVPNLVGAALVLTLRDPGLNTTYLSVTPTLFPTSTNRIQYAWGPTDTATPGSYLGQITATFVDGTIQTFPTQSYFTVYIKPSLGSTFNPQPSGTLLSDVVQATRDHLSGDDQALKNLLAQQLDTVSTSVVLTYGTANISPGMRITVGTEVMYVWANDPTQKTLTVQRGDQASTVQSHAAGHSIRISPRFTAFSIVREINNEIRALSSKGIFAMKELTLAPVSTASSYNLAEDVDSVYEVIWTQGLARRRLTNWRYEPTNDLTNFPSGNLLYLQDVCDYTTSVNNVAPNPAPQLTVRYKTALSPVAFLSDSVAAVSGIPESAIDILALGAAINLAAGRAIEWTDGTSIQDSQAAQLIRTNDLLNAPNVLIKLRQQRIDDELKALRRKYRTRL
jgi:hypothetical protein